MKKETRTMVKILHNSAKVSTTFDQILSGIFLKVPPAEMVKQMDSKNKEIKKVVLEMVKILREDGYVAGVDTGPAFEEYTHPQERPEPVEAPPDPEMELSKILGEEPDDEGKETGVPKDEPDLDVVAGAKPLPHAPQKLEKKEEED